MSDIFSNINIAKGIFQKTHFVYRVGDKELKEIFSSEPVEEYEIPIDIKLDDF